MADKIMKPGRFKLLDVRLSYPHLDKPQGFADNPENKAYSSNFVAVIGDPMFDRNRAAIKKAVAEAMAEKWGDNPPKIKKDRRFYTVLDEDDADEYFPVGSILVRARTKNKPLLVSNQRDANGKWQRIEDPEEISKFFYPGARVNAVLTAWGFDHAQFGRRIACSLETVQFRSHDKRIGGGGVVDPDDAFDEDDVPEIGDVSDSDFDDDDDDVI